MNKLWRINYSFYVGIILVTLLVVLSILGPTLAPYTLTEILETHYSDGQVIAPPLEPFESKEYPFGTDKWGYDLLTMILFGIRHTIFISLVITIIKMSMGTVIGIYIGTWKKTPGWLESIENSWSYVPLFLVLYFFLKPINFGNQIHPSILIGYFILITSMISIPSIVSSVRKKTREIEKSVFIEAARVLGANRHRIIWKHIFPQMKESLLVMFVLEIVYVITIMGQLALMNIFIGGTIVRYDPLIYLSVTKEISGLVGQARGNLFGTPHILIVPLIVLLIITVSFSLLANGLKNRYQANYQRTSWIKTGFEPRFVPVRVQYSSKKRLRLTGEKLLVSLFVLSVLGASSYLYTTFAAEEGIRTVSKAKGVENGSFAKYQLQLKMLNSGTFSSTANITVKNKSNKEWNELVFYFIPNALSKAKSFESVADYTEIKMKSITIDGEEVNYSLENDLLKIMLEKKLDKGVDVNVKITYTFTVSKEGNGFFTASGSYYLGQWYPMLATFQDGRWNKADYKEGFKSYHTDFSDFTVQYNLPSGYQLVSSADKDAEIKSNEGTVEISRVREFYLAILKPNMKVYKTTSNGVEIRLFSRQDHDENPENAIIIAKEALNFFQERIGKYPHRQLDILLAEGYSHEYPGVVMVDPYHDSDGSFKNTLIHEIAHQYFYGVVANDSYQEAWLDEGFSEFATNLYYYIHEGQGKYQAMGVSYNRMSAIQNAGLGRQYSNVPLPENQHPGYILGQPAVQLFNMIEEKYRYREKDFSIVLTEYLADYYQHFQYQQVDTSAFIRFTKDYFHVPTGYFNEWLDTTKIKE
ncbi:ABC transporter permease subunit [Bacillus marasmi]|uniref:ABC transporter permease subunit n=1 Tax=Bacillus marasmi TaxID=1926279 RepID=UPI0011C860A5|nr:ABC transporter permease subunit [Bacillus marasmi]